jgi:hypothetical protein
MSQGAVIGVPNRSALTSFFWELVFAGRGLAIQSLTGIIMTDDAYRLFC